MRLWGIADEPFWPARNGSWTSPISVCWRLRISVAKRSSEPPTMAIAVSSAACRSRWTIWVLTGSAWRPSAASTSASIVRAEVAVRPDRPGDLAGPDLVDGGRQPQPAALDLERPAGELEPERRRLGVDRVGPAHHHRGGFRASPGDEHGQQPVAVEQQPLPGGAQLEREPGIDDVAAGQTEVEVATLGADRFGDLADEGDDVVVGRALDLGDPLDVDPGTRLERGEGVRRDLAAGGLGARDRELDAEHRLEPGGVRPDRAHLGERVARDHRAAVPAVIGRRDRRPRPRPRRCRGGVADPERG